MTVSVDFERRFGGVSRLYGEVGLAKFKAAHVCVIGIGGVGSWAAEALARNAIGTITLIDLDNIVESNVNRQIHALEDNFGKAKVTAMAERIQAINPIAKVNQVEDFVTAENVAFMLANGYDVILDAIDDAKAKVAIAAYCKSHQLPLVIVGGAGGRLDPTKIKIADLANVTGDRLLAKVRNQLRREHAFPKGNNCIKKQLKFDIQAVYSDEQIINPVSNVNNIDAESCEVGAGITGLNCAGYGSSVTVTAPFGFTAAQLVLSELLRKTS